MKPPSDTPRTNRLLYCGSLIQSDGLQVDGGEWVQANDVRTLERETTALRSSLAEAQRKLETMTTIAEEGYPGIAHDYEEMRIRAENAEAAAAKAREDAERWRDCAQVAASHADKLLPIIRNLKWMATQAAAEPWKPCERGADDAYLYDEEGHALACWFWKQHANSVLATAQAEAEAYASLEFIAEFRNRWRELWTHVENIDAALRGGKDGNPNG